MQMILYGTNVSFVNCNSKSIIAMINLTTLSVNGRHV